MNDINTIGLWVMRVALIGGAIICAIKKKEDVAGACLAGLVLSFIFL
jgi:hypothetical protein